VQELQEELLEIAELEAAASQAEVPDDWWVQDLLHEEALAHGLLGLDEP
jgi:hypothetical protein